MAIDQNAQYPVGTGGPSAAYPEGEALNSTAPGALDGFPWEKEGINDLLGFQQALLRAGGVAASGIADTALVSQYLQMIIELAQGRALNYDDSGVADAYVLDVQANQQAPANLFDGQEFEFIVGNTSTGASTVNPVGTGIKNIVNTTIPGTLTAGERTRIKYRLSTTDFEITTIPNDAISKSWVNFNGVGVVAVRDSFNVSSITDNGTGDYTVNFTNAMNNANYNTALSAGDATGQRTAQLFSSGGFPSISGVRVRTDFNSITGSSQNDALYVLVNIFAS